MNENTSESWTPLARVEDVGSAPLSVTWDGVPWLLVRLDGAVRVMHDVCPHRRVPLSAGTVVDLPDGQAIECGYHGWAFGADGLCAAIPALGEGRPPRGMGGPLTLPSLEAHGVVWATRSEDPPPFSAGALEALPARILHRPLAERTA